MMAFSRTSCLSLSPACIKRATVTFPSADILTQQSADVARSIARVASTPGGRAAPLVATGVGDAGKPAGTAPRADGGLAAAGGGDCGGGLATDAGVRTRIVK